MPRIGDPAPSFSLPGSGGGRVSLSDFAGKKIVLYFYPKDDTPGCTKEACDFRDHAAAYRSAGAEVIGVSPDTVSSHDEFKSKYQLPFLLLEDADHGVADAYGVWKEKTLYGRTFMGIERTTFLVDEQQKVAAIFNRVQVDGHADHVLAVLKGEQPAPTPIETAAPKGGQKVSAEPARMAPKVEARPTPKPTLKPVAKPAAKPAAPAKKPAPAAKKPAPAAKKPAPKKAPAKPAKKAAKPVKKAAAKPAKKVAKPAKKKKR